MTTKIRQTQQERRRVTQQKLLTATITCLVEEGYNAVTTTKVCQRSGMSQGAIFKYYPTKHALLTAAIERLYEQLIETYEVLVRGIPTTGDRIPICLQALWTLFELPELLAVFDLHTAARTDPELQKALAPFERRHREQIRLVAAKIFPEAAHNPKLQDPLSPLKGRRQRPAEIHVVLQVSQWAQCPNAISSGHLQLFPTTRTNR